MEDRERNALYENIAFAGIIWYCLLDLAYTHPELGKVWLSTIQRSANRTAGTMLHSDQEIGGTIDAVERAAKSMVATLSEVLQRSSQRGSAAPDETRLPG